MFKNLKKILLILRKLFRIHPNAAEDINPDDFYHSKQSAEGWELVAGLNDPGPPIGAGDTGNKISRVKTSLPPYPVVWTYFIANGYPDIEARRFYKRYQIMGWNEKIITILNNWYQLADHWVQQAGHSTNRHKPKSPPNDTHSGADNRDTEPV